MSYHIEADSLQDLQLKVADLLLGPHALESSPRGLATRELIGLSATIDNPRNRLVQREGRAWSLPFALGEFLWYMRGDRALAPMAYYSRRMQDFSDDGHTLHSAYGARIFGRHPLVRTDQWRHAIDVLRRDADSRQAVVQIRTPEDAGIPSRDHPCTLALQFLARRGRLDMVVSMRSNDLVRGTAYDVFCFTLMQEVLALELGLDVGHYHHHVGSWHLYGRDFEITRATLAAGHRSLPMPAMPEDRSCLPRMIEVEHLIRAAADEDRAGALVVSLPAGYWRDWEIVFLRFAGVSVAVEGLHPCYAAALEHLATRQRR